MKRLAKCSNLAQWLSDRGAYISNKLQCEHTLVKGVGLRCVEKISQFEVLAKIPLSLCIQEQVLDDADMSEDDDFDSEIRWSMISSVMDEIHKGKQSLFHPYLSTLPRRLDSLPLFWSDECMANISCTSVGMLASTEKRLLLRMFHHRHSCTTTSDQSAADKAFLWAAGIVKSRMKCFNGYVALIPYLDLINHEDLYSSPWGTRGFVLVLDNDQVTPNAPNTYAHSGELAYHLIALADTAPGTEVLIDYSLLSFQNKVSDYGIIDKHSDVTRKFYMLAMENFSDASNPTLLTLRDTTIGGVFRSMIEDGVSEGDIQNMLDARAVKLGKLCEQNIGSVNADCKFIRETDLFYVKHCSQRLSQLVSDEAVFAAMQREEHEDEQKMAFMETFFNRTGLKIEI